MTKSKKAKEDDFTVEKTPHGLYTSCNKDGKPMVTSATEEQCRALTHFYLKGLQDGGFTTEAPSYAGVVAGKL
jgi:hypothetical protein